MIAIIDYGMGNLKSVHNAFKYVAPNTESIVTSNPDIIHKADRVVFPGQGAMPDCIREMDEKGLREVVISSAKTKPFLGICIGLQMLFDFSEEGNVEGLGLLKGKVKRFVKKADSDMKIPHMGWNRVDWRLPNHYRIRKNLEDGDQFYFVHSYKVETADPRVHCFNTDYGGTFTSGIISSNCIATQFHPEKSQSNGIQLYRNFLENIE